MKLQVCSKLADLPPSRSASGSEWQFQIFTVRAHMGRSTGRSIPPVDLPVDLNGNFRFLLLELTWADQLADLPPGRSASGSEWQFQIFTV